MKWFLNADASGQRRRRADLPLVDPGTVMDVNFELTSDDLVAFTVVHSVRSPTILKERLGCFVGSLVLLLVLPVMILLTTQDPVLEPAKAIWPLLLGPVLLVLILCRSILAMETYSNGQADVC